MQSLKITWAIFYTIIITLKKNSHLTLANKYLYIENIII